MAHNAASPSWRVLQTTCALKHPDVQVSMETVELPDGQVIQQWPKIYTNDYVSALVLNSDRNALVLEGYRHGVGWSSWQMVEGLIEANEDPVTAVQRTLLTNTGYQSSAWTYLGSYVVDPNQHIGVGHFFCARSAKLVDTNAPPNQSQTLRWVGMDELRFALLDGRIATLRHAIAVSLALLTVIR